MEEIPDSVKEVRWGNATLLDQISVPISVRMNRLGHSEARTTMNYTHVVTSDERKAAEELGKILRVNERNREESDIGERTLTLRIQ